MRVRRQFYRSKRCTNFAFAVMASRGSVSHTTGNTSPFRIREAISTSYVFTLVFTESSPLIVRSSSVPRRQACLCTEYPRSARLRLFNGTHRAISLHTVARRKFEKADLHRLHGSHCSDRACRCRSPLFYAMQVQCCMMGIILHDLHGCECSVKKVLLREEQETLQRVGQA